MRTIHVIRDPAAPYQAGSARERAWHILKAFDGCSVDDVVSAWALMEHSTGVGTRPVGWLSFFCGPSKRRRDGRVREVLALVEHT